VYCCRWGAEKPRRQQGVVCRADVTSLSFPRKVPGGVGIRIAGDLSSLMTVECVGRRLHSRPVDIVDNFSFGCLTGLD